MLYYSKKISEAKLIVRDVSIILFWLGILMLIPMAVALIYGEPTWFIYLLILAAVSGPSYIYMNKVRRNEKPFTKMTLVTIAVTWIALTVVGALPFFFPGNMSPLDSYFESVSSVTAGMTVIPDPGIIPHSVLFWRAMMAWIGGIGITAFLFYSLLQSESAAKIVLGEGYDRLKPNLLNSAKEITKIYAFWTIAGILLLAIIGVPVFDAFSLSMTAVSTVGVDVHTDGWNYYRTLLPDTFPMMTIIVAFLMLMGSISFVAHYRVVKSRNLKSYLLDSETKIYLMILLVGILIVSAYLLLNGQNPIDGAYEVITISTTGGFETVPDYTAGISSFLMGVFIILALIGGSSNSPSGGIRVRRLYLLFKFVFWKSQRHISPEGSISHFKHEGKPVEMEEVTDAAVYVCIYVTAIILVTSIMVAFGYDAVQSTFIVTSAQAGGGTTPIPAYTFDPIIKVILIGTMFFGRLEFYPLFALILYVFRRK